MYHSLPGKLPSAKLALALLSTLVVSACSDSNPVSDTLTFFSASDTVITTLQAAPDNQATRQMNVTLSVAIESQAVAPVAASGMADIVVNRDSGDVSGALVVSGLSGEPTMVHLHAGFAGDTGPVIAGLETLDGSTWIVPEGTKVTDADLELLLNGGTYLNVHTQANPRGEIRGQVLPPEVEVIRVALNGEHEVPPLATGATGTGTLTINTSTGAIWANVLANTFEPATMVHIHQGARGVNGPVLIGMVQDAENPAFWRSTPGDALGNYSIASLPLAGLYFNVHTPSYPTGEVRGQIGSTRFIVIVENRSYRTALPAASS